MTGAPKKVWPAVGLGFGCLLSCGAQVVQSHVDATPETTASADARDVATDVAAEEPRCAPWHTLFAVGDAHLDELSGLVYSPSQMRFFAHNDSGDRARFFALSAEHAPVEYQLAPRGTASSRDWEDMARIESADGAYLIFADTGDNAARDGMSEQTSVSLYRVREPNVDAPRELSFARFELRYADRPRDVEAIYALRIDGVERVVLVSKENANVSAVLYVAELRPADGQEVQTLAPALTLPIGSTALPGFMVTAADARFIAGRLYVALRTYTTILLFDADARGLPLPETVRVLTIPPELQGEALALAEAEGASRIKLYTVAEGRNAVVHETTCRL